MKLPKIPYSALLVGPWILYGIGAAMNMIIMGINHGQMPVLVVGCSPDTMGDDLRHACMTSSTHLKFFCDWINLGNVVASVGDLFIWSWEVTYIPALAAWLALVIKDYNV